MPVLSLPLAEEIQKVFSIKLLEVKEFRGEWTLVMDLSIIQQVARYLKEEKGFGLLLDISGVDHWGEEPRFEVVYHFYNLQKATLLRVKGRVSEANPIVPTLSFIYPTANWHEREAYDMFGIIFEGHPDLRRILMWEGYPYYPLRKDFPVEGKETDQSPVAFAKPAPLDGGPFVSRPAKLSVEREPRAREDEELLEELEELKEQQENTTLSKKE
ncbi:NADH-quinone oxidoreductase subunit C [Candidatus Methylacidiphilum infernorum]|uniref:NADH-quinone oxidoreductase subunit C n=2 Tax=Candidatus Methylacidiphilum infernorum TaxID=511746 RepID=B3DXN6_METI4|nr:NADH-quinone oxidoreductase subunit C [Candidatus Methylacidiphilum infernorum]ACD82270.1 NADH dehydrogenase subunit C [Methylacidiphilum infernorum V4]ANC58256.1 NADH-quinone oxidoreductase subunit C [Candidatus Methylacidiphilum infernorum]